MVAKFLNSYLCLFLIAVGAVLFLSPGETKIWLSKTTPETNSAQFAIKLSSTGNSKILIEPFPNSCVQRLRILSEKSITEVPTPECGHSLIIDLAPYSTNRTGILTLEITAEDGTASNAAVYAKIAGGNWHTIFRLLIIFLVSLRAGWKIMGSWQIPVFGKTMVLLGTCYYLIWLGARPYYEWANDMQGHLSYLKYLCQNWNWLEPYSYNDLESWHPPTYYYAAAGAWKFSEWSNLITPIAGVKILSLAFYWLFLCFGLRCLALFVEPTKWPFRISAVILIFWPLSFSVATRINSDVPLYCAWAAMAFYLFQWTLREEPKSARGKTKNLPYDALIWLAVALAIKSTALVLIAVVLLVLVFAWTHGSFKILPLSFSSRGLKVVFSFVVCLAINMGRFILNFSDIYYLGIFPDSVNWHFGGTGLETFDLAHFISFDVHEFVSHPASSNDKFIFYLLKTSLFGDDSIGLHETRYSSPLTLALLGFIFIWIYFVFKLLFRYHEKLWLQAQIISIAIPIVSLVVFAFTKKWIACQDFRFIVPILIPITCLYAKGLEQTLEQQGKFQFWALSIIGLTLPVLGILNLSSQF